MLLFTRTMNFLLIEGYQTCSILMVGRYIYAPPCPTLHVWDLVVSSAS